jgi:catechol 2,3-dioxygenase-like lactoylglutathione lyase family enzyme
MTDTKVENSPAKGAPALKLNHYSHATLECKNIKRTRQFFEDFLGFETVQMADISFWSRLPGGTAIVVVQSPVDTTHKMAFLHHNGVDVATEADVDAAHQIVTRDAEKWNLTKITKPQIQHGTYAFYFWDLDHNAWEVCANPPGGYAWAFERGDQVGKGHMSQDFERPASTLTKSG